MCLSAAAVLLTSGGAEPANDVRGRRDTNVQPTEELEQSEGTQLLALLGQEGTSLHCRSVTVGFSTSSHSDLMLQLDTSG